MTLFTDRLAGDIGYEPEDVERNMEKHFMLAHKWGCVLLLDEADVFLAKRNVRNFIRSSGLVLCLHTYSAKMLNAMDLFQVWWLSALSVVRRIC